MSELKALKNLYARIDESYIAAKDSFYATDRKEFHLIVSSECLTLAECKMLIADEIVKQLEKGE